MIYACDVETSGLHFTTNQLLCFAYYSAQDSGVLTTKETVVDWYSKHCNDYLIWQNGKFDQKAILKHCGIWVRNDFDTLLAASLLPDKPHNLDLESLCQHYLGVTPFKLGIGDLLDSLKKQHELGDSKEDHVKLKQIICENTEQFDEIKTYCLEDCKNTYNLFEPLYKGLVENNQIDFFTQYLMPFANKLAEVEYRGIRVDSEKLEKQWLATVGKIEVCKAYLYETYFEFVKELELDKLKKYKKVPSDKTIREKIHFNWGSRDQKLWLLKEKLGFPCVDFKGKECINREVLEEYQGKHPIIEDLLSLEDLMGEEEAYARYSDHTYDNRIHTNFSLTLRNSGRLSSSDPPLQNVDKDPEIRSLFTASPGKVLVVADFSQIEPAFMAHFSQDPALLWAFNNKVDYYSIVTAKLLGLTEIPDKKDKIRAWGKVMGLALPYGMGLRKIGRNIFKQTGQQCGYKQTLSYKDLFFSSFPGITELIKSSYREVQEHGYVETLFGRRQYTAKYDSENKPINRKIQTSASDLACFSQLWVSNECSNNGISADLLHLVHDEVIYETSPEQAENFASLLDAVMCHGYKKYSNIKITVPLTTECFIGTNWSCKK